MAKPIILITVNSVAFTDGQHSIIVDAVKKQTNNEYHVLTAIVLSNEKEVTFNVYNDCKGLPDIDIEKLIDTCMASQIKDDRIITPNN